MRNIICKTIPNDEIKIRKGFTGADWWWTPNNDLEVRIASELVDWRERACLAIHEISEALICRFMGITFEMVDEFDSNFKGENEIDINAGDDPKCPYRIPHMFATAIERILAGIFNVNWIEYDKRLSEL